MKDFLASLIAVVLLLILIFGIIWAVRLFSSATVEAVVIEPEKGVHCVKLVTSDGVAVDCWRTDGQD